MTFEPYPKVMNMQEPEPNLPRKEPTDLEPKCDGSYSVLSLNEIVGTFIHFTVNEAFYFRLTKYKYTSLMIINIKLVPWGTDVRLP